MRLLVRAAIAAMTFAFMQASGLAPLTGSAEAQEAPSDWWYRSQSVGLSVLEAQEAVSEAIITLALTNTGQIDPGTGRYQFEDQISRARLRLDDIRFATSLLTPPADAEALRVWTLEQTGSYETLDEIVAALHQDGNETLDALDQIMDGRFEAVPQFCAAFPRLTGNTRTIMQLYSRATVDSIDMPDHPYRFSESAMGEMQAVQLTTMTTISVLDSFQCPPTARQGLGREIEAAALSIRQSAEQGRLATARAIDVLESYDGEVEFLRERYQSTANDFARLDAEWPIYERAADVLDSAAELVGGDYDLVAFRAHLLQFLNLRLELDELRENAAIPQ